MTKDEAKQRIEQAMTLPYWIDIELVMKALLLEDADQLTYYRQELIDWQNHKKGIKDKIDLCKNEKEIMQIIGKIKGWTENPVHRQKLSDI